MQDDLRLFKAGIFSALAHPTRIAIIQLLRDEGEISAEFLHSRLGLESPQTSQHLAVLRAKGLVQTRRDGQHVYYSLCDKIIGRVLDLMGRYFHSHLPESLDISKLTRSELPADTQ